MIVRFTRRAEDDLAELVSYLAARSPEGARNVAASLRHDGIDILHIRHASRRPWIG